MNSAALSPNGVYLAAATGQGLGPGTARIWDVTSGRQLGRLSTKAGPFWVVAWSPKGDSLAIGDHEGTIRTYDAGTWKLSQEFQGPRSSTKFIAWSPDGTALATGDDTGTLWGWDATNGKRLFQSPAHSKNIDAAAWSPDGEKIATAGWDNSVAVVDAPRWSRAEQPTGPQQFCEDCGLVARWEMDCVGQSRESVSDRLGCFLSASHFGGTPEFRRAGRVVTRWQLFCARQQRY